MITSNLYTNKSLHFIQVHFGISAKNAWSKVDSAFNYRDFYNNIVMLIEDLPDPEWKELLKG